MYLYILSYCVLLCKISVHVLISVQADSAITKAIPVDSFMTQFEKWEIRS